MCLPRSLFLVYYGRVAVFALPSPLCLVCMFMQVLSAVLGHFTRGMPPLSMRAGTKVPADFWGKGETVHYTLKGKGRGLCWVVQYIVQGGAYGAIYELSVEAGIYTGRFRNSLPLLLRQLTLATAGPLSMGNGFIVRLHRHVRARMLPLPCSESGAYMYAAAGRRTLARRSALLPQVENILLHNDCKV